MLSYILILDGNCFIYMSALDPLSGDRARRNGATTPKRLEARVHYVALLVYLNLQLHHVSACRSANDAGTNVQIRLVK